jgi:hypothetical protein
LCISAAIGQIAIWIRNPHGIHGRNIGRNVFRPFPLMELEVIGLVVP